MSCVSTPLFSKMLLPKRDDIHVHTPAAPLLGAKRNYVVMEGLLRKLYLCASLSLPIEQAT